MCRFLLFFLAVLGSPLYAAEPISIDTFITYHGIQSAVLSPNGQLIAKIEAYGGYPKLTIEDAETKRSYMTLRTKKSVEAGWIYEKTPRRVTWITNDLIAVDYGYAAESMTLDGTMIARLGKQILRKADDNPESPMVLVITDKDGSLALANARTGDRHKYRVPGGRQIARAFDAKGALRAVTLVNSEFWRDVTSVTNWYKPRANGDWEKLAEFGVGEDYWIPLSVPDEANKLVVSSRIGRETVAIFEYDTKLKQLGEMMAGHPTVDILGMKGTGDQNFDSVVTGGMIPQTVWFEAVWGRLQKTVDAALPGRINVLSGNPSTRILIHSAADVDPGSWYVLDVKALTLRPIGRVRETIDFELMRPKESVAYAAKDGLKIPAFLTRPAGVTKPAPAVILIHGGPTVRDGWDWDEDVQFLASRGYVVFQPQFRGSSGFGRSFEAAGYGQWGLAMQDDVTAGVEWLISQGIADRERICIVGASYGGYAALWGLAKTPDLYKCGVSFAGVSDIELMFKESSDSNSDKVARQLMRSRIGDIRVNKTDFDRVSPLKNADRIKAPVLLMHGVEDERVPVSHARKMKRALQEQHKSVELIEFAEEGHGLTYLKSQAIYFLKLEAFLGKHIGPGETNIVPAATLEKAAGAYINAR